jgi:inhibitor of KinA
MDISLFPRILSAGDSGLTVEFGDVIDPAINDRVVEFVQRLDRKRVKGIVEVVPTYCSATVYFDPGVVETEMLREQLQTWTAGRPVRTERSHRHVQIPVLYGGEHGPDLEDMCRETGLSSSQIVDLHSSVEYRVYMLGFSPGFPYLGTVPEHIALPRLAEPRTQVPAGSVGIAGAQTGIYPQESPGGWRLIGRTPLRLYDPSRTTPFLLQVGDGVRFVPIGRQEYDRLAVPSGTHPRTSRVKRRHR